MSESVLASLEEALALGDILLIVRSGAAIAEVTGGPLRRGEEWVTVGDEAAGASHVHVNRSAIHGLRFRQVADRNAALDVLDAGGETILSVSFRKTNPGRPKTFDPDRLAMLRRRFGGRTEVRA